MEKRSQVEPMTFQVPVERSQLHCQGLSDDRPWERSWGALVTTELWVTFGEQGQILGSYMCDMYPAILQGPTCRNDQCEKVINRSATWIE